MNPTGTTEQTSTSGSATTGATTPTTGATTPTTGATTTDPDGTTIGTAADTTIETTGPQACDAIVGSTDCTALADVSPDLTLEECMMCQGAPCGQEQICDQQYPCVDGIIVLRGCCTDAQCADLKALCGMFIGTNNVCVLNDDV